MAVIYFYHRSRDLQKKTKTKSLFCFLKIQTLILFLTCWYWKDKSPKDLSNLNTFLTNQFSHEVDVCQLPMYLSKRGDAQGPDLWEAST